MIEIRRLNKQLTKQLRKMFLNYGDDLQRRIRYIIRNSKLSLAKITEFIADIGRSLQEDMSKKVDYADLKWE